MVSSSPLTSLNRSPSALPQPEEGGETGRHGTRDLQGQGKQSLRPDGLTTVTNELIRELRLKFTP